MCRAFLLNRDSYNILLTKEDLIGLYLVIIKIIAIKEE